MLYCKFHCIDSFSLTDMISYLHAICSKNPQQKQLYTCDCTFCLFQCLLSNSPEGRVVQKSLSHRTCSKLWMRLLEFCYRCWRKSLLLCLDTGKIIIGLYTILKMISPMKKVSSLIWSTESSKVEQCCHSISNVCVCVYVYNLTISFLWKPNFLPVCWRKRTKWGTIMKILHIKIMI